MKVSHIWWNEKGLWETNYVKAGFDFQHGYTSIVHRIWTDDDDKVHLEVIDPADFFNIKDRQPTSAKGDEQ
jgi:hypothetical protein